MEFKIQNSNSTESLAGVGVQPCYKVANDDLI